MQTAKALARLRSSLISLAGSIYSVSMLTGHTTTVLLNAMDYCTICCQVRYIDILYCDSKICDVRQLPSIAFDVFI